MKTKRIYLLFIFLGFQSLSYCQDQGNADLFIADMLTLADNFAQPASEAAAYQASAGWFSAATSLEKWDLRLSLHGNALFIPERRKTYRLSNNDLQLLSLENTSAAVLPTAFGTNTNTYLTGEVTYLHPVSGEMETTEVRFKAFDGIDREFVPHAFAQLAIGLPYKTELTLRAMPEVTIDDVTASTFGLGLKHNLSQYFNSYTPEGIQLAAAIAYSKFKVRYAFAPITVENLVMMDRIRVDADLWMAEAIASKRWGALELFLAAGAASSAFEYEMEGGGQALPMVNSELQELEDISAYFKGDFGVNFHLGLFRLSAMATAGKFFNGNVGVHVRI